LPAQTFTVLHTFTGQPDGGGPFAGVILDSSGNVYGTTNFGGVSGVGTVFRVDAGGRESVLHNFSLSGGDAHSPVSGLIRDAAGSLYGTTIGGGQNDDGAIYRITKLGKEKVLHSFANDTNGLQPMSDLVFDKDGNAYGTTFQGGDPSCQQFNWCGVVFRLSRNGKYTVLHAFSGPDGAYPVAGVILDVDGNLYGTTSFGGTGSCIKFRTSITGCGVVFKLDRKGKLTVLHNFTGGSDGQCPVADLIRDAAGNLYGTTSGDVAGSDCDSGPPHQWYGTLFKIDKKRKETVLHNFAYNGTDGTYPQAALLREANGDLYGTTTGGGSAGGGGTIFKLSGSGTETVLYNFTATTDGAHPLSRLVRDKAGNLYGTTLHYGDPICGCGTVFEVSPP
jgi:uncharacterized repeat protein (TIGR03803 family)